MIISRGNSTVQRIPTEKALNFLHLTLIIHFSQSFGQMNFHLRNDEIAISIHTGNFPEDKEKVRKN
jgi:hypothetical protein